MENTGAENSSTDTGDINDSIDFLARNDNPETTETEKPADKTPPKEAIEKLGEVEPEKEIEEPEEEPEKEAKEEEELEEPLEDINPEKPGFKDINTKYPNFFKDFPDMRQMFFRDQKIGQLYPTVEDAEEAHGKAQVFDQIQSSLLQGDPSNLLEAVGRTDRSALERFATNILPSLFNTSEKLFAKAVDPIMRNALRSARAEAKANGNKNLEHSVAHIARYLQITDLDSAPKSERGESEPDPEKVQLQQRLGLEYRKNAERFGESIQSEIRNQLERRINLELKSIDGFQTKTKFEKNAIINAIIDEMGTKLESDSAHMYRMNGLNQRAFKDGFDEKWKPRIINAYLGGAFPLLKSVRGKFGKSENDESVDTPASRKVLPRTGGPQGNRKPVLNAKDVDWDKTSDIDFLSRHDDPKGLGKIVLKK